MVGDQASECVTEIDAIEFRLEQDAAYAAKGQNYKRMKRNEKRTLKGEKKVLKKRANDLFNRSAELFISIGLLRQAA